MRKKIVAGNWKMNKLHSEAFVLMRELEEALSKQTTAADVLVFPPYLYLQEIQSLASKIKVGAQNCHWEDVGAYTGEVSAAMLESVGVSYVIIGHSERRNYFNETNTLLSKKVLQALNHNLIPIFCIGETLEQRNSGKHFDVIKQQLNDALFHLTPANFSKVVIAYEPVWAIGTGVTATTEQAQEVHAYIRKVIKQQYSDSVANSISILYGGSCNAQNAKELFACADVDGGLIGGASLKPNDFLTIINSI